MPEHYNLVLTVNYDDDTENELKFSSLTIEELKETIRDYLADRIVTSVVASICKI